MGSEFRKLSRIVTLNLERLFDVTLKCQCLILFMLSCYICVCFLIPNLPLMTEMDSGIVCDFIYTGEKKTMICYKSFTQHQDFFGLRFHSVQMLNLLLNLEKINGHQLMLET